MSHIQCTSTEYIHRIVHLCPKLGHPRSANEVTAVFSEAATRTSLTVEENSKEKTRDSLMVDKSHLLKYLLQKQKQKQNLDNRVDLFTCFKHMMGNVLTKQKEFTA